MINDKLAHVNSISNSCQNTKMKNHVWKENIRLDSNTRFFKTFNFAHNSSLWIKISSNDADAEDDLNTNEKERFVEILDLLFAHKLKLLFVTVSLSLEHSWTKIWMKRNYVLFQWILNGFNLFSIFFRFNLSNSSNCRSNPLFQFKIKHFIKISFFRIIWIYRYSIISSRWFLIRYCSFDIDIRFYSIKTPRVYF